MSSKGFLSKKYAGSKPLCYV